MFLLKLNTTFPDDHIIISHVCAVVEHNLLANDWLVRITWPRHCLLIGHLFQVGAIIMGCMVGVVGISWFKNHFLPDEKQELERERQTKILKTNKFYPDLPGGGASHNRSGECWQNSCEDKVPFEFDFLCSTFVSMCTLDSKPVFMRIIRSEWTWGVRT